MMNVIFKGLCFFFIFSAQVWSFDDTSVGNIETCHSRIDVYFVDFTVTTRIPLSIEQVIVRNEKISIEGRHPRHKLLEMLNAFPFEPLPDSFIPNPDVRLVINKMCGEQIAETYYADERYIFTSNQRSARGLDYPFVMYIYNLFGYDMGRMNSILERQGLLVWYKSNTIKSPLQP